MKIFLVIGLMVCTSILLPGQVRDEEAVAVRFRYLVHEKQLKQAAAFADNQQLQSSHDPFLLKSLLEMQMGLGKLDAAIQSANHLVSADPAFAYYCLAKIQLKKNDLSTAMEFLKRHLAQKDHYSPAFIKTDPDFEGLDLERKWINVWKNDWYTPAEELFVEGEYDLSLDDLAEADRVGKELIQLDPKNPSGWFLLARVNHQRSQQKEAENNIEKAINQGVGDVSFLEKIFNWLNHTGQYARAVSVSLELRKLDPTNPQYLIGLAMSRINAGQESSGIREMQELEDAGVESDDLTYLAAKTLINKDPAKALELINRAISTGNLDKRYFNCRADVLIRESNNSAAISDLSMSLDVDPDQVEIWFLRAQLRYNEGDEVGACHDWKRALDLGSKQAADKLYRYCRN